jgi:hypothetical protein
MMEVGRDYRHQAAILDALNRIAKGVDRLAEDPVIQMEIGPPVCPHCGVFNPKVAYEDAAGEGPLYEFFMAFICQECDTPFAAVPVQWSMHTHKDSLEQEIRERAENFNGNGNGRDEA